MPIVNLNLETKFYLFDQNNSGGRFIVDDEKGIGEYVFIEATSIKDAVNRAEDIGIYFDGCGEGYDCECCGDRWSRPYGEGKENIQLYDTTLEQHESWLKTTHFFVHRINGDIIKVVHQIDMDSDTRPRPKTVVAYVNNKKTPIKDIDILN